jgi:hypothetical protein
MTLRTIQSLKLPRNFSDINRWRCPPSIRRSTTARYQNTSERRLSRSRFPSMPCANWHADSNFCCRNNSSQPSCTASTLPSAQQALATDSIQWQRKLTSIWLSEPQLPIVMITVAFEPISSVSCGLAVIVCPAFTRLEGTVGGRFTSPGQN